MQNLTSEVSKQKKNYLDDITVLPQENMKTILCKEIISKIYKISPGLLTFLNQLILGGLWRQLLELGAL